MKPQTSSIVTLLAALLIPFVQRATGITLTTDAAVALLAAVVTAAHGVAALFVRYFPPPPQETPK